MTTSRNTVPTCNVDHFVFDEKDVVDMKQFYKLYKDKLPMLAVFVGGWDGNTPYDCYDNYQVFRINCISSQPRVIVTDDTDDKIAQPKIYTIPVDTPIKFEVIKGHRTFGPVESLSSILQTNKLPVQVRMCNHRNTEIKIGTSKVTVGSFGNLLITQQYLEHYFMANLFEEELKMLRHISLIALSEDLEAAPITGFKHKNEAEYQEFIKALDHQIKVRDAMYRQTSGNPDFAEYYLKDIDRLTGKGGIITVPHPPLPELGLVIEDTYEEIPPMVPPRINTSEQTTQNEKKDKKEKKKKQKKHKDEQATESIPQKTKGITKTYRSPDAMPRDNSGNVQQHQQQQQNRPRMASPVRQPKQTYETIIKDTGDGIYSQPYQDVEEKGRYVVLQNVSVRRNSPPSNKSRPLPVPPVHAMKPPDRPNRAPLPIPPNIPDDRAKSNTYVNQPPLKLQPDVQSANVTQQDAMIQESEQREETGSNAMEEGQTEVESSTVDDNKTTPGYIDTVKKMTIKDVSGVLEELNLGKYTKSFEENSVDGEILSSLSVDDLVNELDLKKLEAIRLHKFVESGHIPQ